jgi:hypothetical protein
MILLLLKRHSILNFRLVCKDQVLTLWKYSISFLVPKETILNNAYFTYLKGKSHLRSITLLVPVLGNIAVICYEISKFILNSIYNSKLVSKITNARSSYLDKLSKLGAKGSSFQTFINNLEVGNGFKQYNYKLIHGNNITSKNSPPIVAINFFISVKVDGKDIQESFLLKESSTKMKEVNLQQHFFNTANKMLPKYVSMKDFFMATNYTVTAFIQTQNGDVHVASLEEDGKSTSWYGCMADASDRTEQIEKLSNILKSMDWKNEKPFLGYKLNNYEHLDTGMDFLKMNNNCSNMKFTFETNNKTNF